jgi:hypothetical protein
VSWPGQPADEIHHRRPGGALLPQAEDEGDGRRHPQGDHEQEQRVPARADQTGLLPEDVVVPDLGHQRGSRDEHRREHPAPGPAAVPPPGDGAGQHEQQSRDQGPGKTRSIAAYQRPSVTGTKRFETHSQPVPSGGT